LNEIDRRQNEGDYFKYEFGWSGNRHLPSSAVEQAEKNSLSIHELSE